MTPGPLTYWLEQFIVICLLLCLILLLPLLPVRDFIAHYWPAPIEELMVLDQAGSVRLLLPAREVRLSELQIVARSRPLSLVTVETSDRALIHGFPIGVRLTDATGLLAASRVDLKAGDGVLVLQLADESHLEIDGELIQRVFYVNEMNLLDRARMTVVRMVEAWSTGAERGKVTG